MKTRFTKIYLVQITDAEGNEIKSEYVAGGRTEAKAAADALKQEIRNEKRDSRKRRNSI